jgi:hypothetical protein
MTQRNFVARNGITAGNTTIYSANSAVVVGGASISADPTTGAITMVPVPTVANPNPVAYIFDSSGSYSQASTSAGAITWPSKPE